MKTLRLLFLVALIPLCSAIAHAQTTPPATIDELYNEFVDIPGFTVLPIGWKFIKECYADECFGTNPDSPYGMPDFTAGTEDGFLGLASKMNPRDAFVILMETPPKHRYFSVTPYIFTRKYEGIPQPVSVFESLSDSVNTNTIVTWPGNAGAPFSELAVFIQAVDETSFNKIETYLKNTLGVPAAAIHTMIMPYGAPLNLKMHTGAGADSFTVLMRMAYPDNEAEADAYIKRDPGPVRLLHLKLNAPLVGEPPHPPFAARKPHDRRPPRECSSGGGEECSPNAELLAVARDKLMAKVTQVYKNSFTFGENRLISSDSMFGTSGTFPCTLTKVNGIPAPMKCNGDAPDAVYSRDFQLLDPNPGLAWQDRLLIVGVNHEMTGNVTYMSHSVNRVSQNKGVVGASDKFLKGTGRIFMPTDPDPIYDKLYVVMFAYTCKAEEAAFCVEIPYDNLDGIPPGEALKVSGRLYLDNQTDTRPGKSLLVGHRARTMIRK